MSEAEIHGGQNAVEEKLAGIGFGKDRIDVRQAAPDEGTPVETVQADQPRDDAGRFASPEQPEAAPPENVVEEVAAENEPQEGHADPAVAAVLAKYGGDPEKAIAALAHAQRKLGQQSTEVGELRAQNAEYEAMLQELRGLRSDMQQERSQQPLDQATVDWFEQQALENPYGAAEYARQQGNQMLLQRALSTWKEIDPYQAAVYTNNLQNQRMQQQFEERLARAQQLPMDATINVALTNVRSRNPEYANYDDAIATAMEKYPSAANAVQRAASDGSTGELEAAIETLYGLAIGDTLRQIGLTGSTPESTATTTDVAAPTLSEAHGEVTATPSATDQMRAAMNEEISARRRGVFVAE